MDRRRTSCVRSFLFFAGSSAAMAWVAAAGDDDDDGCGVDGWSSFGGGGGGGCFSRAVDGRKEEREANMAGTNNEKYDQRSVGVRGDNRPASYPHPVTLLTYTRPRSPTPAPLPR